MKCILDTFQGNQQCVPRSGRGPPEGPQRQTHRGGQPLQGPHLEHLTTDVPVALRVLLRPATHTNTNKHTHVSQMLLPCAKPSCWDCWRLLHGAP